MKTRDTLISAAIAGALAALLSAVPVVNLVNCLLCAWWWLAGIFAVWLYRYLTDQTLERGQGLMVGLLTGVLGAVFSTVISAIFGARGTVPPETMAQLEQTLGDAAKWIASPATSITMTLVMGLIFYSLFGVLGGLIGTSIFKPKPQPAAPVLPENQN